MAYNVDTTYWQFITYYTVISDCVLFAYGVVDTVMDKTTIMVTARPIKSSIVGT